MFIKTSSENLLVVGGPAHRTTETLSLNNWQWNIVEPYPNVNDVQATNIISHRQSFYVFGGVFNYTLVTNEILCFKNGNWSKVGDLLSKRVHFSVILIDNRVFIVGGEKKHQNEICNLSKTVKCEQDYIINYQNYKQPVLFSVDLDVPCRKHISKFETKENKELMILSNETFKEIENFVEVHKTNYRIDK